MKNSYTIYVLMMNTFEVELTSPFDDYSQAISNMENVIEWYTENYCNGSPVKNISKKDFDEIKIKTDTNFPNGHIFRINKSNIKIYRKTTHAGMFMNTVSIDLVAKIGISTNVIPTDSNISLRSNLMESIRKTKTKTKNKTKSNTKYKSCIKPIKIVKNDSSLVHGRHVSFIEELKNVLKNKSPNVQPKIQKKPVISKMHIFINDLITQKKELRHCSVNKNNSSDKQDIIHKNEDTFEKNETFVN